MSRTTSEPNFRADRRPSNSSARQHLLGPTLVDAAFDQGVEFPTYEKTDATAASPTPARLRNERPLLSNLAEQLKLLKAQERRLRELIESAKRD